MTFVILKLWNNFAPEVRQKMFDDAAESLLVKHVADPDEIAEAYMFVMKCVNVFQARKYRRLTFRIGANTSLAKGSKSMGAPSICETGPTSISTDTRKIVNESV